MSVFFHTLICWFFIALILVSIFGGEAEKPDPSAVCKGGKNQAMTVAYSILILRASLARPGNCSTQKIRLGSS